MIISKSEPRHIFVHRKLRLRVREDTEREEARLQEGKTDALKRMKEKIDKEIEEEEQRMR